MFIPPAPDMRDNNVYVIDLPALSEECWKRKSDSSTETAAGTYIHLHIFPSNWVS